jgi:hypothetical protein
VPQQRPQVRLEHGCEVGYELPFEGGDIVGVGADEVRCALDANDRSSALSIQEGNTPLRFRNS